MLNLFPIGVQHIEPVIDMRAERLDVVASLELLEAPESSKLNGVVITLVFLAQESPELETISELTSTQGYPTAVHVLGEPVHHERAQHRGDVPGIDAVEVVGHQPILLYRHR